MEIIDSRIDWVCYELMAFDLSDRQFLITQPSRQDSETQWSTRHASLAYATQYRRAGYVFWQG